MARTYGYNGVVTVGTLGAGTPVGQLQSFSLDIETDVTKTYAAGEQWETAAAGVSRWSGSIELELDEADAGRIALSSGAAVTLNLYPGGDGSGQTYYSGAAIINSAPISQGKDQFNTITFNFMGNGALSTGTVA